MLSISVTGKLRGYKRLDVPKEAEFNAVSILEEKFFDGQEMRVRFWVVLIPRGLRSRIEYFQVKDHVLMIHSEVIYQVSNEEHRLGYPEAFFGLCAVRADRIDL